VLRKDEEFVLSRGQRAEISSRILVLSPAAEYPAPEILKWLEHPHSLKATEYVIDNLEELASL
jgi:hypothetical protein